jgi:hypothetical protein
MRDYPMSSCGSKNTDFDVDMLADTIFAAESVFCVKREGE